MRATATLIALSILAGAWSPASTGTAAPRALLPALTALHQVPGQQAGSNNPRREADALLQRARQAIAESKFELAEQLIAQAEQTGVKYDAVFARFIENTPDKLRQELQRQRAKAERVPKPPANLYAASPGEQTRAGDRGPAPRSFAAQGGSPLVPDQRSPYQPNRLVAPASFEESAEPESGRGSAYAPRAPGQEGSPATLPPGSLNSEPGFMGDPTAPRQGFAGAEEAGGGLERPMRLPSTAGRDPRTAEAARLLATAAAALDRGDVATAQRLSQQVEAMQLPPDAFGPNELRPWEVTARVNRAVRLQGGVVPAVALEGGGTGAVQPGVYRPDGGPQVMLAQNQSPVQNPSRDGAEDLPSQAVSPGVELYQQGIQALEGGDRETALKRFSQAWQHERELDPVTRGKLKDKLTLLQAAGQLPAAGGPPSPLEAVNAQQQLLRQKLYREITAEQDAAEKMVAANDPKGALARLNRLRDRVGQSELDPPTRKQLLTMVDRTVESLEQYIERNRGQIELDEQNLRVNESVTLDRQRRLEMQDKLAELVEQFNTLLEERRYAEAEVVAKQARELDPENPVVQNLTWKSRFVRRFAEQQTIRDDSEAGFYGAITSVAESGVPFDDREPFVIGDATRWRDLTKRRRAWLENQGNRLSPAEQEIQKSMKNPVDVRFSERPLAEVLDKLSQLSGVPIYLDPRGLAAEGVTTDTPVTIRLTQQISLQSALNLILEPLRLSYVVQNEVLRITSEQTRDSDVYPKVYNVADLVIPIPNFVPSYNVGLPGAIREAHNAVRQGLMPGGAGASPLMLTANDMQKPAMADASVLAQMGATGMLRSPGTRPSQPIGPSGVGGGVQADFDSLIELITTTIAPQSWDDVGGPGAIQGFETNLSLVVSQTQEIHEQIADLLDQLRRLQDLQVTIEVRFITLNDDFFERIGVDFDFDIDDNVGLSPAALQDIDDVGPSLAFGLNPATGDPTTDLDLSFTQDSFASAVPAFGGFDAATAANFGFAILSDIEVFFLLQAAQGDSRTNTLQAPKVTLFNGQNATVSNTAQRPFVTSVIPVVGDFAAAYQPVVVVLSEGTSLSIQAVVSADRRFVRLTLVPFFSRIGEVRQFTFNGRTTSDTGSDVEFDTANDNAESRRASNNRQVTEGTTVQLPTFEFTTVTTTVSVPDGGTVLLGGIKNMIEARTERGVPILSKVPYVNRLFKNVGIGRETSSLMMMVTPRIIIQEEEEEKLGIDIDN